MASLPVPAAGSARWRRCRAHLGVEGIDQVLHRGGAVVLHLHQAQGIGVDGGDGGHDLVALAGELGDVAGAAAVAGRDAAVQAAALAALAVGGAAVGEGGEEVQHIEAGHLEVAPPGGASVRALSRLKITGSRTWTL
jgi:hypothetical protein